LAGGGVGLSEAGDTPARGGGADMRSLGTWSFGGKGTYATAADAGAMASGGIGSFGWDGSGVEIGAADDTRARDGGAEYSGEGKIIKEPIPRPVFC
jgi:hypothetical protein